MPSDNNKDLIFDIGLHKGHDAKFYLSKGFRVVGLEARHDLCEFVIGDNEQAIREGRLIVVEKALNLRSGETVDFYVNPDKDDWGSLFRGAAEKGVGKAKKITVETVTLTELFASYGCPYYAKCDIEGGDSIFVDQLVREKHRPSFVSIEVNGIEDAAKLFSVGYDRFQIVNQQLNPWTRCPNPPREGSFTDQKFTHEMSGLFGKELPEGEWIDFESTIRLILDWRDLATRNKSLAIGWLDLHAKSTRG